MTDIIFASAGIVLLSPAMIVVAVLLVFERRGPVLFFQQRPGLNGRPFTLVKFRSMIATSNDAGRLDDAARITPLGRWLRATSLDELPELWNVLVGQMSIVGPRPLLMQYLDRYSPVQARRHNVRPGLTGYAQVNGRNSIDWDQKLALDVWYVDHRSFVLDLRIIAITAVQVWKREGISAPGEATMSEFMGETKVD
jgi:sugar transferase EpsL